MIGAIRVMVVDASLESRSMVKQVLSSDPGVSVVGTTSDGRSAVELVLKTRPKVIVFGLGEEGSDCFFAVRKIMAHCPTAILLLANPGRSQGEMVAYLLAAGALDAIERPRQLNNRIDGAFASQLIDRVKLLSRVPVITHIAGKLQLDAGVVDFSPVGSLARADNRYAVAIVASTGGPMALTSVLSDLPADLNAPVLVVQHIATGFVEGMVDWFKQHCRLKVRVARNSDKIEPGIVLVAPGGFDMGIDSNFTIKLDKSAAHSHLKPAGDSLFKTMADVYGEKAIGVILTGMGNDGTLGAAFIKRSGGRVIAQDKATSAIFGMPQAAIEAGVVDEILPLQLISKKLVEWIGR